MLHSFQSPVPPNTPWMCHRYTEWRTPQRQLLAYYSGRGTHKAVRQRERGQSKHVWRAHSALSAVQEAETESSEQATITDDGMLNFVLPPSEPLAVIVGGGTCGSLLVRNPHFVGIFI